MYRRNKDNNKSCFTINRSCRHDFRTFLSAVKSGRNNDRFGICLSDLYRCRRNRAFRKNTARHADGYRSHVDTTDHRNHIRKYVAAALIMILMLFTSSKAEEAEKILSEIDLTEIQIAVDNLSTGLNVKGTISEIISGDVSIGFTEISRLWKQQKQIFLNKTVHTITIFLLPMLFTTLLLKIMPDLKPIGELIGSCTGITVLIPLIRTAAENTEHTITGIADFTEAAVPVITTLSAIAGGTSTAAILTPMATLLGSMMITLIRDTGLYLIMIAAVCVCAECIGAHFTLEPIFSLIKRLIQTSAGLMLALFAGILKVQGMLGASFDAASVKTARFAIDKLVPAVGSGIADTMDAAISSVLLVRSAVGVTGILSMVLFCFTPLLSTTAYLIGLRITVAIAKVIGQNSLVSAADRIAEVLKLMIVISATSVTLGLILIGATAGAGTSFR